MSSIQGSSKGPTKIYNWVFENIGEIKNYNGVSDLLRNTTGLLI